MSLRIAVLASGRGTNLQAILDERAAGRLTGVEVALVASDVPGAAALDRARAAGVETCTLDRRGFADRPAFEAALLEALRQRRVEAVALAGFMRLLSATFLAAFPDRVINIHPSLLPAFPGLHAVRQALEHGVKVAGCTVHLVDAGTDSGAIVLQAAVAVADDDSEETLAARILVEEHRLLPQALRLLAAGRLVRQGGRVSLR